MGSGEGHTIWKKKKKEKEKGGGGEHVETHVKAPPQTSVAFPAHGSVQLASGSLLANEFRSGAHQHSRPYSSPAKTLPAPLPHCVRQVWIVMLVEDVCVYLVCFSYFHRRGV